MRIKKFDFADLSSKKPDKKEEPSAPKDFSFFGTPKDIVEHTYIESDVRKMVDDAFNKGFEKASAEARQVIEVSQNSVESQIFNVCNNIMSKLDSSIRIIEEQNKVFREACVQLASKIAKRIAGEALKNDPTENIAKLFENSIREFYLEEIVNIHVHPKYVEELGSKFAKIAIQKNFPGKINFIPDSKIHEFDCTIEWQNTGINLKNEEIIQKVDELISEYCKSIYSKEHS